VHVNDIHTECDRIRLEKNAYFKYHLRLLKYSRYSIQFSWLKATDVSGTISVPITSVRVPETSVIFNRLSLLIARQDIINFSRFECVRFYIKFGNQRFDLLASKYL
jgi:hypothetical protein